MQEREEFQTNSSANRTSLVFPYMVVLGVALLRLEPGHIFNGIPVFSSLLLFAALRPARELALPLMALIGVDIFLTTHRFGFPLAFGSAVTWGWYLIVLLLGSGVLRNSRSWLRAGGCSLLASISYFVASNFTVWAEWNIYSKTLDGLGACYVAALPFFRNSLVSELLFSLCVFGLLNLSRPFALLESPEQGVC